MAFPAGLPMVRAFISHYPDWDTLLVRTGQHLWTWAKSARAKGLAKEALIFEEAWVSVVTARAQFRAPMIARREEMRKEAGLKLAGHRRLSKNPVR